MKPVVNGSGRNVPLTTAQQLQQYEKYRDATTTGGDIN